MYTKTVAQHLASTIDAYKRCIECNNTEWRDRHQESIENTVRSFLPSGSGIDCGTKLDYERSNAERIVLRCSFHHMDENGYYDGWTEHTIIVRPSFSGLDISISGRNRNDIKGHLYDVYDHALSEIVARHCGRAGLIYDARAV